ncbi:DEAD/DEAH box helicase [Atlantibacter hermannii]|uniref:DEAD/DEAH box helicase n=1 Tax=Atlantibacter hermannii TaxID=565 RepID=UPI0028AB3212|nr:ATP-binding domain-containing protein [Atlantibacter hermannii]ELP1147396.1 DEAD/DEAH box helicase [Salmonella enterica]ELP1148876.1 DEAD/DEAH box helicase [Salmonella enterica]
MIDFFGIESGNIALIRMFEGALAAKNNVSGQYFRGFPVVYLSDSNLKLNGLLCSPELGVVICHITEDSEIDEDYLDSVDQIHMKFKSKLAEVKLLRVNRNLHVPINTIVYCPNVNNTEGLSGNDVLFLTNLGDITNSLADVQWNYPDCINVLLSNIQSLSKLKATKKRNFVENNESKGSVLKKLDNMLSVLDPCQLRAVLENIDGVQRIRGLAGSGKTIVLARKVAHIHSQKPDWKIAVTFNSRSLKEQFRNLIEAFSDEDGIDWKKIDIIHAWGGTSTKGLYYEACLAHNITFHDLSSAKVIKKYDEEVFQAVCRDFLENKSKDIKLYDFILVDEAQDFSSEFLQICYSLLDEKKRLVYAYDELQSLSDRSMPSPEDIWGFDENGKPNVTFQSKEQDVTLDICYRNPGAVLSSAHALGFGIYHNQMIQMFDYEGLWQEIGYEVLDGKLAEGERVVLGRTQKSSPSLLSGHNSIEEIISFIDFDSKKTQSDWIAQEIIKNVTQEELLLSDILVIHPDTKKMRSEVGYLRGLLFDAGINSSIAGVTSSPDEFFSDDSVTFTSIFRAKGNEAAMVYIMDGQYCNLSNRKAWRRNVLFTAMTRTKAWLRVCGIGQYFNELKNEFEAVKQNGFRLEFVYPTVAERETMRVVNRDMTSAERRRVNEAKRSAANLNVLLDNGTVNVEDIPLEVREQLIRKLMGN